jgi:hypothetical protein
MTWGIYNNKSLAYLCSSGKKKPQKQQNKGLLKMRRNYNDGREFP